MWFGIGVGVYLIMGAVLLFRIGWCMHKRQQELIRREIMREYLSDHHHEPLAHQFIAYYEKMWAEQDAKRKPIDDLQLRMGYMRDAVGDVWFWFVLFGIGVCWLPCWMVYQATYAKS